MRVEALKEQASGHEQNEQWQKALTLLREMPEKQLGPHMISYSAAISACEKGEQ